LLCAEAVCTISAITVSARTGSSSFFIRSSLP
jgi:hypothetical protein